MSKANKEASEALRKQLKREKELNEQEINDGHK